MNETINQTAVQAVTILGHSAPFTNSAVLDIYLVTLVVALFITLINKYMTDQVAIKALRADMKNLQKKMRETMKTDPKKAQIMQQEIMKKNLENMRHTMNPKIMLITMLPILVVFSFIRTLYGPLGNIMDPGINFLWLPWGWLGTYIFFSLINSILIKKILKVA